MDLYFTSAAAEAVAVAEAATVAVAVAAAVAEAAAVAAGSADAAAEAGAAGSAPMLGALLSGPHFTAPVLVSPHTNASATATCTNAPPIPSTGVRPQHT